MEQARQHHLFYCIHLTIGAKVHIRIFTRFISLNKQEIENMNTIKNIQKKVLINLNYINVFSWLSFFLLFSNQILAQSSREPSWVTQGQKKITGYYVGFGSASTIGRSEKEFKQKANESAYLEISNQISVNIYGASKSVLSEDENTFIDRSEFESQSSSMAVLEGLELEDKYNNGKRYYVLWKLSKRKHENNIEKYSKLTEDYYKCDPCTQADFEMKRRLMKVEEITQANWGLSCNFNDRQDYQRKKELGRVKSRAALTENIIVFVQSSYEESIKEIGGVVDEKIISIIRTNTPRIPLPNLKYDYVQKDDNYLEVHVYIKQKELEDQANLINRRFKNEIRKARKKYQQNIARGEITDAIGNLAAMFAYSRSDIPLGKISGESSIGLNMNKELRATLSNLDLRLESAKEDLEGVPYHSDLKRNIRVEASFNGNPVSGLLLRAKMEDGLSDWEENVKEMKSTNQMGYTNFMLGRILSKQSIQTIDVDLDYVSWKKLSRMSSGLWAYVYPNWYDDFEKELRRGFESLKIQLYIDPRVEIHIPSNINVQAIHNFTRDRVARDFQDTFNRKKGVNVVTKNGKNTLTLKVVSVKDRKTNNTNLKTSLIDRKQTTRAEYESSLSSDRAFQLDWDREIENHVTALLENLEKGDVRISGDNGIHVGLDGSSPSYMINNGRADIRRLSFGPHTFSFSKAGFRDRDSTIIIKYHKQQFQIRLEKIDFQVELGLPYPPRDFNLQIFSNENYTLNFKKNQLSFSQPENIYRNNIVNLPKSGNYTFEFSAKGRKTNKRGFSLDGNSPTHHQINFDPFSQKEIMISTMLPGLNQLKMQYKSTGTSIMISSLAALVFSIYSLQQSKEDLDEYHKAQKDFELLQDVDQSVYDEYRADAEHKYNAYTRNRKWAQLSVGGFAALTTASFLHVEFVIKPRD
jgi:hypothetical protein